MYALALLLLTQGAPPYVAFPEPGLDDPAAYEGYTTRVYRDARDNAVQIYLDRTTGRVVHLWADALNESIGFTVRDSGGQGGQGGQEAAAAIAFGDGGATVGVTGGQGGLGGRGGRRWLRYSLTVQSGRSIRIGLFLLGSMRVERDLQYADRHRGALDAPFIPPEILELVATVEGLPPAERRRALRALRAREPAVLRARLAPRIVLEPGAVNAPWRVRVAQRSLDGRHQLSLILSGDPRRSHASLARGVATVRPTGADALDLTVEIATDGPALTPLTRDQIFNDAFRRFADSARSPRLEREIRGFELLSSREKLMAGLPNYATYFGRDMLMTALLMEPVWSDTMPEHVIAAALRKLAPTGEVSHEEALGGQAIRENAAEYNRRRDPAILANLEAVRENYFMVDDDFQLPVVAARYFANPAVPVERKRRFLAQYGAALARNLAYVWRRAEPYAREPVATNLVGFQQDPDGWWHPGSWRDSRVGYAGGRFAFDVNAVWVPAALRAILVIRPSLPSAAALPDSATLARAIETWRGAVRHFEVALAPQEVRDRVRAKLGSLPEAEREYWERVLARSGFPADTVRFLAVSLDSAGQPIPVMSTDPGMLLLLEDLDPAREAELLRPFVLPYPVGLFVDGLGPLATNDVYASPEVWAMFERDLYHSPRVVWGREVNVLLAALARRGRPPALQSILDAVERSGFRHAELWSYRIDRNRLRPVRYGSGSDVQLWSLTDLAVEYLLAQAPRQ
ncbi:MAG TPA: hypothetical protein VGQ06_14790 [Gemmatimonadales bacterium]|jgi:hypothetical protein|nr:hypothetical protein [Gemmatimonadales bacterium]